MSDYVIVGLLLFSLSYYQDCAGGNSDMLEETADYNTSNGSNTDNGESSEIVMVAAISGGSAALGLIIVLSAMALFCICNHKCKKGHYSFLQMQPLWRGNYQKKILESQHHTTESNISPNDTCAHEPTAQPNEAYGIAGACEPTAQPYGIAGAHESTVQLNEAYGIAGAREPTAQPNEAYGIGATIQTNDSEAIGVQSNEDCRDAEYSYVQCY